MTKYIFGRGMQGPSSIYNHQRDVRCALGFWFGEPDPRLEDFYLGETATSLNAILKERREEADVWASFSLLADTEAAFRTDYLHRIKNGKRRSKADLPFIQLHQRVKGNSGKGNPRFEDDLLDTWRKVVSDKVTKQRLSRLKKFFQWRHWIAHGRYWSPKFGAKVDYDLVCDLVSKIRSSLPLRSL